MNIMALDFHGGARTNHYYYLQLNIFPRSFFEQKNARVKTSLFQVLGLWEQWNKVSDNKGVSFSLFFIIYTFSIRMS